MQFTALELPEYLTLPKAVHLKYKDDGRNCFLREICAADWETRTTTGARGWLEAYDLLNMSQISSCVNVNVNA